MILREYQRVSPALDASMEGSPMLLRDHAGVVHIAGKPGSFGAPFTQCERTDRGGDVRYGNDQLEETDAQEVVTCLSCLAPPDPVLR